MFYVDYNFELPVCVIETGWEQTKPNHTWSPNGRPRYLIHLIKSGKVSVERENGTVTQLTKGDAFISHPDEASIIRSDGQEPCEYYWIAFNGRDAKNLLQETTKSLYPKYKESGILAIDELLKHSISDNIGLLNALFMVLNAIKDESAAVDNDPIRQATLYIESNYYKHLDVSAYAKSIGLSRCHFTTLFTKRTGMSPYSMLIKTRIENAMVYLKQTKLSISQIAYKVGFSSLDRFGRMFKAQTGFSPKAYRVSNLSIP